VVEYIKKERIPVTDGLNEVSQDHEAQHKMGAFIPSDFKAPAQETVVGAGTGLKALNLDLVTPVNDHYMMNGSSPKCSPSNQFYFSRSSFYNSR